MARRSAGLDTTESAAKVNVALNLVNQRILAMQNATDQGHSLKLIPGNLAGLSFYLSHSLRCGCTRCTSVRQYLLS